MDGGDYEAVVSARPTIEIVLHVLGHDCSGYFNKNGVAASTTLLIDVGLEKRFALHTSVLYSLIDLRYCTVSCGSAKTSSTGNAATVRKGADWPTLACRYHHRKLILEGWPAPQSRRQAYSTQQSSPLAACLLEKGHTCIPNSAGADMGSPASIVRFQRNCGRKRCASFPATNGRIMDILVGAFHDRLQVLRFEPSSSALSCSSVSGVSHPASEYNWLAAVPKHPGLFYGAQASDDRYKGDGSVSLLRLSKSQSTPGYKVEVLQVVHSGGQDPCHVGVSPDGTEVAIANVCVIGSRML